MKIDKDLLKALSKPVFRKFLLDSTLYSIHSFTIDYDKDDFVKGFMRYKKYGRKEVCRILNWPLDVSSTVYGYRTNLGATPCFVTYNKPEGVSDNTNYNDHFIDHGNFAWESRHQRRIEGKEVQKLINSDRILLFVTKEDNKKESEFYFIGDCSIVDGSIVQSTVPKTGAPIVHFTFSLDKPVEDGLYRYFEDI